MPRAFLALGQEQEVPEAGLQMGVTYVTGKRKKRGPATQRREMQTTVQQWQAQTQPRGAVSMKTRQIMLGFMSYVHPKVLPIKLLQRAQPVLDLISCFTGRSTARFSVSLCQRRSHFFLPQFAPQSSYNCRHSSSILRTAGCFSELLKHKNLFVSSALLQRWVHSSGCLLNDQLPPNSPLIKTVCAVLFLVKCRSLELELICFGLLNA